MMLKQSTAAAISFGPFVDKTDGVTPEVGLVSALDHASTGILLSKNGGALTIRHATVTATTYDAYGNYIVTLDTTDTNTLGSLRMQFIETATCLPVWRDFEVVTANVWNSFHSTDILDVNVKEISDDATAADNLETMLDGTGGQTLSLGKLNIVNSAGDAIVASSTGGNGHGINASGNGSGTGMTASGGVTSSGHGINAVGGGLAGSGFKATGGSSSGQGIDANGGGSGNGMQCVGGATGAGLLGAGGATSGAGASFFALTSGAGLSCTGVNSHGVLAQATGTAADGIRATGILTGDGMRVEGGVTGLGLRAKGGSTSGDGMKVEANGGGRGLYAVGVGATGDGILTQAGGAGNGIGAQGGPGWLHETNGDFASDASWTKGTGWTIAAGVATHASGSASSLTQAGVPALTQGTIYAVVYTVSGRTTGTITATIKGTAGTARSTNATFTELIVAGAGATDIEFAASSTFDGSIDAVDVIGPPGDGHYAYAPGHASYAGGGAGFTAIASHGSGFIASTVSSDATAAVLIYPQAGNVDGIRVRAAGTGETIRLADDGTGNLVGDVTGNLSGSVGSVAAGGITATSIATGAIDADALAADAVAEIADGVWDEAIAGHAGAGSTGAALSAASAPSAAAVADAVWDEAIAGHLAAGSTGLALNSAGSAGDPWSTAIPGAYGAGTAGSRLGKLPDATAGAAGGVFIAGANAATSVTTALTANITGNVTGNLSGSVGSVTGAVGSVTGSVGSVTGAVGSVTAGVTLGTDAVNSTSMAADTITAAKILDGAITAAKINTGAITAAKFAAGAIDAAAIAANAIGASELAADAVTEIQAGLSTLDAAGIRTAVGLASANLDTQLDALPTAIENADALLDRNMATGTDSGGRTPRNALRLLRNKVSESGGTMTVTKEDDATSAWTAAVTTDAAANPITAIDPA